MIKYTYNHKGIILMSRAVKTDYQFNKDEFARLLRFALGTLSYDDFASKAGISKATVSQYIRSNRDTPPTPQIIKKIVDASDGRILYKDILFIAGYSPEKYIMNENTDGVSPYELPLLTMHASSPSEKILNHFILSPYISQEVTNNYSSVSFATKNCPFKYWHIQFINTHEALSQPDSTLQFKKFVCDIMWKYTDIYDLKLSAITDDYDIYIAISSLKFPADLYLSAILIEKGTDRIIEETALNTHTQTQHPNYQNFTLEYISPLCKNDTKQEE